MPQYEVALPNGKKYRVNSPEPLDQNQVWQAVQGQIGPSSPEAFKSTAELEAAPSAPTSLSDIGRSLGSGLVGGVKSVADVFGAGTNVSKGLGEAQDYLQQGLTQQRKDEIARRQELQERAARSGSLFQEAKAYLGGVTEAPLQSLAQAAGSSAPSILAGIAAIPAGAPAGIALGVGTIAKLTVGAMQGVGEYKGSVFDAVKDEYLKQGKTPAEAEALAQAAQEYSRSKAFEIGGSAVLGALDAVTGVEPSVGKAMRKVSPTGELTRGAVDAGIAALPKKALEAPTYRGQFLKGMAGEAPLEGSQGAFGQYGVNVALQQAGADVTPMQGVLGAGVRDAAVGALFGGVGSPLGMRTAKQEFETDQFLREVKQDQELEQKKADALKRKEEARARAEEGLGTSKLLALPAPSKPYEPGKDPLIDPLGRFTEDELGKAIGDNKVVNYLNRYRKDNNLPKLKSYSLEDIKDALPDQAPEGEEGYLQELIAYKTGYKNETYTPQDVFNAAVAKNVATETKGWNDFLTRATGKSDLNEMAQPELHSVVKALDALKRTGKEEQLVLPEGSNASRFTQDQYNEGVTTALMSVKEGKPTTLEQARKAVQAQTDLKTDRDADHMLRTAAGNEDLIIEKGAGYQAVSKSGEILGTYASESEARRNHRRVEIQPVQTEVVRAPEEAKTERRVSLPEGYEIEKNVVEGDIKPEGYAVREEGSQKNIGEIYADEATAKGRLESIQTSRAKLATTEDGKVEALRQQLEAQQNKLTEMEAAGQTGTAEHSKALNAFKANEVAFGERMKGHLDRAEQLRQPVKIVPIGKKAVPRETHTLKKSGKTLGTFPTSEAAQNQLLAQMGDEEVAQAATDTRQGGFANRAKQEQYRRSKGDTGRGVGGESKEKITKGLEAAGVRTPEVEAKIAELEKKLIPMLAKFGLKDVGLNVVRAIRNNAEGSWKGSDKLIKIALDATEPIKTMRHEALHALKELGFFTPQQWEALKREAKKTWIKQYLEDVAFDENTSRLEAYRNLGLTEEDIIEEAIADAFGDWEGGAKPPPGMMAALFKRMQQFFEALKRALTGAGFDSAEEIFGKIERGELKPKGGLADEGTKLSLAGAGVPMSTRNLMEVQTPIAQQELGLNTEAKRGRFNNVREIATALNQYTLDQLGAMDRNNLTQEDSRKIAKAIADEVAFQLNTSSKTGTGLGWYSNNYPNAVKRLANRFPELGKSQHARSVFSAIVAVTSNGERVAKNIDNAIKLYSKLRDGKPMVAMGNRRGTALKNNLAQIQYLLAQHNQNFEKVLLKEITVKEMNAKLRELGEDTDSSYLADTVVPAAAVYFGPKLGAFYANLSGSEGYLTMDLWWTRSINRMRGLLMPQATDASINKFRDMMDRPSATREEVVAATIPLHDKYEEYGFNTELEHLMGSKEPRKKDKKPAWFKRAEEKAGDAYDQFLFDHNTEKMANTIYKNEFEMLEEAPFTATDRKFMYDAARKAQSMLQKEGIDLTLADIQAALWYYEKRLYEKLSGRKADDIGYEEAIIAQANQGNGRARPSVVFDQQFGGGTQPGAEGQEAVGVRGQPAGTEEGVSGEQKLSLRRNEVGFVGPSFDEQRIGGNRGRGSEVRNLAPLAGSPSVEGFSGPDPRLVSIAEQYAKDNGISYKRQRTYVEVDEDRARRIADAYDKMEHDPQDPEVKEAYQNLIRQTRAQYDALVKNGYRFWFTDYNIPDNAEYLSSPWNAMRDIRANKTMGVFPTDEGFGSGDFDPAANPLLEDTGLMWPVGGPDSTKKSRVLANDLFRAVHDAFGHGLEGAGFRARGEENAWLAHSKLFTGSALAAITSETRGQNSWLNYGPQGEKNKTAKIEDTVFAEQKTGLMPSWTWSEGLDDTKYSLSFAKPMLKPKEGEGIVLGEKQDKAKSYVGLHYGQAKVNELSGAKYGTGIRGAERRRLEETDDARIKKRIYFYIPKTDGSMPLAEAGLGGNVYTQQFDNIADGAEVNRLYGEANGDANTFESNVVDAGYDGYAMPNMGMMVILNHNAPVNFRGTVGELAASGEKLSLRQVKGIFDKAEKIPEPPGVESIRQQWIGGVSGIGDRDSMYDLYRVNGSEKYIQDVQDFVREELGDDFKGYRLMSNDELEEIQTGAMGSQFVSFTLSPEVAKAFKNIPAYADKTGMSVVEMDLTPEHVAMIGHPGELELVVDYGQGYNPSDIKVVEKYSLRTYFPTAEEAESAAYQKAPPSTPAFKRFFGASKVMEEGRPQVMYHGSLNEFSQFNEDNRKGLIFVTPSPAFAEEYALLHATRMEKQAEPPVKVYPLWVRAETPFDYENPVHVDRVMNALSNSMSMQEYINTEKEVKQGNWAKIEDPRFVATLKNLGFDSLYVKENKTKNLAVFKASQVKSVTGNIGEFNLETKDMRFSLKKVRYSDERFKKLWDQSFYTQNDAENKTKGYLAFVNPIEFVRATATPEGYEALLEEKEPLDLERMRKYDGPMYLSVSERDGNWKITGHEGRHRMLALHDAGYTEVPVYIEFKADNAQSIPVKILRGQFANSLSATLIARELEPLSYANKNKAMEKYTSMDSEVKYSLPKVSAQAKTRRDETTTRREQEGWAEGITGIFSPEAMSDLRANFIHRYNQLGIYDRLLAKRMGGKDLLADVSAEAAANMSDLSSSVTASAFGIGNRKGGIPVYKNGMTTIDTSVRGPLEILAPLGQFNSSEAYQDFQFWAGVQRGVRLNKEGREENFDEGDVALAEEYLKAYKDKGVDFNAIRDEMNKFNNGLVKYMTSTGVIDAATGAHWMKWNDYIPFYRQAEGDRTVGPKVFNAISGVKPPKELKGRKAPLADYLETIVRNTQAAINAGMKNAAAQKAVNVAVQIGDISGAQRLDVIDNAPDCVQVLENGKQVSYRVADQLFINAVKSLNTAEMPGLAFLSAPANLLRNLVTKDPGFILANLARDSLSAWVTSGSNATPLIGTVANFAKALGGKSKALEALQNAGVLGGYEFSSGILKSGQVLEEDLAKKYGTKGKASPLRVFKSVWDGLESATEASDAATRMAVYERVLEETGSETEAIYRALEVMNFNRKGSSPVARILTAAIPFLNARIQGLDVFYRAGIRPTTDKLLFGRTPSEQEKALQKTFIVRGLTMMALSSAYFLAVSDDEEWKKQEQETKDNYWIMPGVGKFPTPFEVGFLFKTVPERILAYTLKDDTGEDLRASMSRGLLNTFAFNPIPQVAKPLIEYAANYNFFTGRPIVGQGMEGKEPQFQVGPNTTHSMEWLGKQLGMSPMKLEQVYGGYTGTMGMYALTLLDAVINTQSDNPNASKRFEQLPIVRRFAADPEARGNITQFYELKRAVDAAVETQNFLLKTGRPEEFEEFMEKNAGLLANKTSINNIEKTMKQMRDIRKMVQSAQMSADEKRDALIAIGQAENDMTVNIQTIKKIISELK